MSSIGALIFCLNFALGAFVDVVEPLENAAVLSDHGDTPLLNSNGRSDAKISDLHCFTRGGNIVIAVCLNTAVPPHATSYVWPNDLKVRISVDSHSQVSYSNAQNNAVYGGTITNPAGIESDTFFRVSFSNNQPSLFVTGLKNGYGPSSVQMFTGLRDDPFIRGPRQGRNVAAIVLEMPIAALTGNQDTILVWTTTKISTISLPFVDLAGRSLRSMFPENDFMNTTAPSAHFTQFGVVPDVMIYNTELPAAYPNGRELTDDVVDLVGDPRVTTNDAPFPSTNDLPFLATFPYLAPPHP